MLLNTRILFLVALLVLTGPVQADLIDFEGLGLAEGGGVGNVVTATNSVTFGAGMAGPTATAFAAQVGAPLAAFTGVGGAADTPTGGAGQFFLTDEPFSQIGPTQALNYFITFAVPIISLNLDLYDFRTDGGASVGDMATLQLFSDNAFMNAIPGAFAKFTIPAGLLPDGNVVNLSIPGFAGVARSASLILSPDIGTGIDNVDFTSTPEPWTVFLLGSGLMGMGALRRRNRQKSA